MKLRTLNRSPVAAAIAVLGLVVFGGKCLAETWEINDPLDSQNFQSNSSFDTSGHTADANLHYKVKLEREHGGTTFILQSFTGQSNATKDWSERFDPNGLPWITTGDDWVRLYEVTQQQQESLKMEVRINILPDPE